MSSDEIEEENSEQLGFRGYQGNQNTLKKRGGGIY